MCVRAHMCAQTMIEDETRADTVPQHRATNHIAAKSLQSCPTLCDPIDGSPPGSPIPGILQARTRSGLPFPSPMRESEVAQSCPTLSDPMDCSPPGSSIHGIFQARVLEWGAIAFSTNRISSHLCHVTCVADTVLNYFHEHYFI